MYREILVTLKNKIRLIFENKFAKDIILVTGGATLAQIINVLVTPVITRIYLPEEYGVMSLFLTILTLISFPTLMYEVSIPIEKDKVNSVNILALSLTILIIFTILILLITMLAGTSIFAYFKIEKFSAYKYYIPLGVLLIGLHNILLHWIFRKKKFKLVSKAFLFQNICGNLVKTFFGFLHIGSLGLIIGVLVNKGASIIPFTKELLNENKKIFRKITLTKMKWCMRRYINFPLFQTPSIFILRLKNHIPTLFMAFYGAQVVGQYGLAISVTKLPLILVGRAVRNVFFAEAADISKKEPEKLRKLSNNLVKKLFFISLIPFIFLCLWGPEIFSYAFGEEWVEAGYFSRVLTISVFADLIFSPTTRIFEVIEKQKSKLYIDTLGLFFILSTFIFTKHFNLEPVPTVFLYSIAMALVYLTTYFFAEKYLQDEINRTKL